MGVYGVALAGWASNNKYSLMGGLRSSAQIDQLRVADGAGDCSSVADAQHTLSFRELVNGQAGYYLGFIPRWSDLPRVHFREIFSFLLFLIAAFAETNRIPFDLPEAENRLTRRRFPHTEYSSMKFAAFFMAEYANMVTVSCVGTLLFLGGWQPIFPAALNTGRILCPLSCSSSAESSVCTTASIRPGRLTRITLPAAGARVPGDRRRLSLRPFSGPILVPLFWFASKVGVILFPLHLGPRDASALPL